MFATLFGLGFYLQMKRGEGKPGFEARYSRRLFWLLVFGWLNMRLPVVLGHPQPLRPGRVLGCY